MDWFPYDKAQLVLAGALGGVVRWLTLNTNQRDGIVSIIIGAICAVYLSPLTTPLLEPALHSISVTEDNTKGLSGFLIGIGGVTVSGIFIDIWRIRKKKLQEGETDGRTGKKGD